MMLPEVEDTPSRGHGEGDAVGTTKVEPRRSSREHEAVTGQKQQGLKLGLAAQWLGLGHLTWRMWKMLQVSTRPPEL
jgi:hypothetical protein